MVYKVFDAVLNKGEMTSKKTQAVITLHMYVHLQSMYNT